ncbi:hypothetical protein JD844_006731 [Phrynosoma platyrhinos]|uniref:CUB and zona pellucida-like domain-containing protein 1 n=1 Tax=Phrynosoma platyrhinos TaxID=52577 RepID=A0ABQ7T1T7_PHRPL|nr:hypothetical protein JD844_006731 [Phrynosoma platyrhinos]
MALCKIFLLYCSGSYCGGILTAPSGYIDSPYYPGNNLKMECIWEIQTASYSHIVLDIYYVNNQCGGNLSLPFGSLSGPYYPGNNVSIQCVWEIEVSPLDHIILQFSHIRLDCSKEYVEIFDGPIYSSYLLGRICSGIYLNYTYTSTSNTITILLHRDSDLSGYGFDAYYYSVQVPHHTMKLLVTSKIIVLIQLTSKHICIMLFNPSLHYLSALSCSGEYMVARIRRTYLQSLGYNAWEVYLNSLDSLCTPQITQDYVIFNIPFSGCGTVRQERNNGTILYSNIIKTSAPGYIITRKRNFQFHIMCEMNENTIVETMFYAQNAVDITEKHVGSYSVNLGFYPSPSFSYEVHSSPYHVLINQELYFQATLNSSDPNLVLFLDTCVASPYAHNFTTLTYYLIRSGCAQDSTYRSLYSPSNNVVRFTFNSFKFLNQYNEVYLQCKLVVCMANDYASRCYQGCLSRKKRTVDEDNNKLNVVLGPFKLQGNANEDKRQELVKSVNLRKDEVVNPLTVATVFLAAMVFVLSGLLLNSKLRRKNYHQIY